MIDTDVQGSPRAVRAAAGFLETMLQKAAESAADRSSAARRSATSSWDGDAADAYLQVSSKLINAADEQARHAAAAGRAFEEYAGRLEGLQERMDQRRREAQAGGLLVLGTVIEPPSDAPSVPRHGPGSGSVPRWNLENAEFEAQRQRAALYDRLADEVAEDRESLRVWIDDRLNGFWRGKQQPVLAELIADALSNVPGAAAGAGLDVQARLLDHYVEAANERSRELTREAAAARQALRSGSPARRTAGEAVDLAESRRAASVLAEAGEDAGKVARRIPVLGYAISFGSDGLAIAHGDSPGRVVGAEGASIVGGVTGAAITSVAAGAVIGFAPPVLIAVGAMGLGLAASVGANYAWDHWVPEGAKDAIDEGLKDVGSGVKELAGDVGDALTFWN